MEVEGAGDDQAEFVDVDRLAVEVVGTERDRLQGAFAGPVTRGDDDLGVRFKREDFGEGGEAFGGAVGIGWKAEVEGDDRGFVKRTRSIAEARSVAATT